MILVLCTALSQQPWTDTTKCTFRPKDWRQLLEFAGVSFKEVHFEPVMAVQFRLVFPSAETAVAASYALSHSNLSARQSGPVVSPHVLLIAASPRYVGGQSVMARHLLEDLRSDGILVDFLPVDPLLPRLLQPLDRIKYVRTLLRSLFYVVSLLRHVPGHNVVHIFSASYASFLISPGPAS